MAADLSVFDDIETNLAILDIDEIKRRLQDSMKGVKIESPVFNPGAFLYRARKVTPIFNKQTAIKRVDLTYPPKHLTRMGRLNRDGQPVFYCSLHKESVFYELPDLQVGDELILTFWKTSEKMFVNNIGYTEYVFQQLGAKRAVPEWRQTSSPSPNPQATIVLPQLPEELIAATLSKDEMRDIREIFSKYFMRTIGQTENYKYKLTTAIGELHFGEIVNYRTQFAGVLYPSVRSWANGDNLALLPWYVDQHVEFRKAVHVRIDARTETTFSITSLDTAKTFDTSGSLVWLGRLPNWTIQTGQQAKATVTPGPDDDGDYEISKDGFPCHWLIVDNDTGHKIEAR